VPGIHVSLGIEHQVIFASELVMHGYDATLDIAK